MIVNKKALLVFFLGCLISVSAQAASSPSASLIITVNGSVGSSYYIGQSWGLHLVSNIPNTNISLCAINNLGVQSCTPVGITDVNGGWYSNGTFTASTVGPWTEWVSFPSQNVSSNQISFTVSKATLGSLSGAQPYNNSNGAISGPCFTGAANQYLESNPTGSTFFGAPVQMNSSYFATPAAAQQLAQCLGLPGSSVVNLESGTTAGDSSLSPSNPNYAPTYLGITLPNGLIVNAGYLIGQYVGNPSANVFGETLQNLESNSQCAGGPGNLFQGVSGSGCTASSGGSTSAGASSAASTGSGSTSSGSASSVNTSGSGSSNVSSASTMSTVNSSVNSALPGFSQAISNVVQASGQTGTTGGATSGGACASTATATLSSSVTVLQGLATVLSSANTSPAVLSSVQNLISAIAQVLSALSNCVNSGASTSAVSNTNSQTTTTASATKSTPPTITSITPSPWAITASSITNQTQEITIKGTGFIDPGPNGSPYTTANAWPCIVNTVNFAPSANATPFVLPSFSCVSGSATQLVFGLERWAVGTYGGLVYPTPGTYQVYITNASGTSNSVPFTITQ